MDFCIFLTVQLGTEIGRRQQSQRCWLAQEEEVLGEAARHFHVGFGRQQENGQLKRWRYKQNSTTRFYYNVIHCTEHRQGGVLVET